MKQVIYYIILCFGFILATLICGCEEQQNEEPEKFDKPLELNRMVGDYGQFSNVAETPLIGFGLVAGLNGTGSSECDPVLREQLVKYIKQNTGGGKVDPQGFINSKNTAVVEVLGAIPPAAREGQSFDIYVRAMKNTQTTSLEGGRLYTTELKQLGRIKRYNQYTKTLAEATGPIYIDKLSSNMNLREGIIIGGGVTGETGNVSFILFEPSYIVARELRDRINQRFGPHTAKALTPNEMRINIPEKYANRQAFFLKLIKNLYIAADINNLQKEIARLTEKMRTGPERIEAELALNSIGTPALEKLHVLLENENVWVRLHAARCMLDIGDHSAVDALAEIANNKLIDRVLRIEAIRAIGTSGKRRDAIAIINKTLNDYDFEVRFASYKQLKNLGDISVSQKLIGGNFIVDSVDSAAENTIFFSRKDVPKIVAFGKDIECNDNIFMEGPDREVVINSASEDPTVNLMRRHPTKPRVIGPIRVSRKLIDVIEGLCGKPEVTEQNTSAQAGLGINYATLGVILEQMCQEGAINAVFVAGPKSPVKTKFH
jgi:hypothetical protein